MLLCFTHATPHDTVMRPFCPSRPWLSEEPRSITSGFCRAPLGSCCKGGLKRFFSPCGSPCIIVPFLLTVVTVLPWSLTLIEPIKPNPFSSLLVPGCTAGGNTDNNVLVHLELRVGELKYIPLINFTCYFMFTNTQCAIPSPSSPTSH